MNILTNPLRVIFFFYLFFLYYSYVRPVDPTVSSVAAVVSDNTVHFVAFFILGAPVSYTHLRAHET